MMTKYKVSKIQWVNIIAFFLFLFSVSSAQSQIISGEKKPEDEKKKEKKKDKKKKVKNDSLTGSTYYLTGMMNYGYRNFRDESVYGSYDSWNDQTADVSYGTSIGIIFPFHQNLSLDIGFSFFGHKIQYNYEDSLSDSTYHFSNNYLQIGVPVKLRYTVGDKFQFFGFAGLTPVNILNIRFNESYNRADGSSVESDVEVITEKLAIFNLMANVGIGVSYHFNRIGITLYPEYRHHLLNTYDPQKPLYHRMYGLGVHAGLTLKI